MNAFGVVRPQVFGTPVSGSHPLGASAQSLPQGSVPGLFGWALNALQQAMSALLSELSSHQVPLPGRSSFGGLTGLNSTGAPLADFLGGATGALAPTVFPPKASDSKGERIPGGKSLYSKGKGMFHKGAPGAPDTYAFENSPAGIAFAAKNGYASIDIDMQITKDGVPVATHWSQPLKKDGFYDPLGKLDKNTKVSEMTFAEVSRLRNKDGQSEIYSIATMIGHLKKYGIAGDFEAKDDKRFASDEVMGEIASLVRKAGIKANLKSIDRGARSDAILETAQEHGFWVRTAKAGNSKRKDIGYR